MPWSTISSKIKSRCTISEKLIKHMILWINIESGHIISTLSTQIYSQWMSWYSVDECKISLDFLNILDIKIKKQTYNNF